MLSTILLLLIYVAFISLGLPDGLLGAGWPSMYIALNVPLSFAGYITMIIAGGTIISSLFSSKLIYRIGTGWVTAISIFLTALGLFGFFMSSEYWHLCLWALPYGLGAGAIDSALNNYVAVHYRPKHMSWLHCFWGIGALSGPSIMGGILSGGLSWNYGYLTIAIVQSCLLLIIVATLPLWKKVEASSISRDPKVKDEKIVSLSIGKTLLLPGAIFAFLTLFCYCSMELTMGLWSSSYLHINRGVTSEVAALWGSFYFVGITVGRFLIGFITEKLGDRALIRIGEVLILLGIIVIIIPYGEFTPLVGLLLVGVGSGPIYPSVIHATPARFTPRYSQSVIGVEMASAYVGSTFMPPLFGLIAEKVNISFFPYYILTLALLLVIVSEVLNRIPFLEVKEEPKLS